MLGKFVKDNKYEHKICGVPSALAKAMRLAIQKKDAELFQRISDGLVNAVLHAVAPTTCVVFVSLGGPFKG